MSHTPTPWSFKTDRTTGDCGIYADGTGIFVEVFSDIRSAGENSRAEALANAEFILKAVNSHDAMLAALKALQVQALQSNLNSPAHEWGWEALGMTRAALALAKGGAA